MDDRRVYILDVYNRYIYPGDGFAKREYNGNAYPNTCKIYCVLK